MKAKQLTRGGGGRSCTVTVHYPDEWRVAVAPSRKAAFAEARARWGDGWEGEPTYSTPDTIYRDITGQTRAAHGQDLATHAGWSGKRDRFRRLGQSYNGSSAA